MKAVLGILKLRRQTMAPELNLVTVLINKVLLGHSHTHSLHVSLWLPLPNNGRAEQLQKETIYLTSLAYLLTHLFK